MTTLSYKGGWGKHSLLCKAMMLDVEIDVSIYRRRDKGILRAYGNLWR